MIDFLFVYGTLRRAIAAPAHELFRQHADYVDEALFQGRLYDLGNYPGAITSERLVDKVHGEVFRLYTPKPTLALLDQYEGIHGGTKPWPEQYRRITSPIVASQHGRLIAWVYEYAMPIEGKTRVEHGDYARHLKSRPNYRPPQIPT